ncbi:MAG: primosomal protein N' [Candidatus Latescibacterota bacterium]|nr:MAG: primosomal protein N' [Candidatus Latescibacterota bacterium]
MNVPAISTLEQNKAFAKVALPVPVSKHFTYRVPDELREQIFVGCRVEVPFGRRILSGVVIEFVEKSDVQRIKPIRRISDTYLAGHLLKLTEWMASYYGCSMGEAAQAVLPPVLKRAKKRARVQGMIKLLLSEKELDTVETRLGRAPRQLELVRRISRAGGRVDYQRVTKKWRFNGAHVRGLIDKKIVELETGAPASTLESIEARVVQLNVDQKNALGSITEAVSNGQFSPILLHGVTGSGKTELYIRAAKFVLERGEGCIVLVPEIGLIPQAVARYKRVFGDEIAIMHSRLTGAERYDIWKKIERGVCRIVLGPRSAIFSPIRRLRLIVVDEEQDDSYKQEDKPRYHARSVALMRGKFENLTVLLGSATPSAESLHLALENRYLYLKLPRRVEGTALPKIHLVDLRSETLEGAFCSTFLLERLEHNVRKGSQSILFLNKRGHARFVQCNVCGWVARCKNCDISLIYHRVAKRLSCHYCGYNRAPVNRCDQCSSPKLFFAGAGTQRVELDLAGLFPGVGILRMDADTTSGKEGHRNVLEKFGTGEYPILIGTQMVAKGHHFPRVNLVGVLYAEESLNYPDFRSSERTFQQLIQVAGRAGRSGGHGEVVVQTFMPDHYAFQYLESHDYDGFMKEELRVRKQLGYPPFSRIVLASFASYKKETLERVVRCWTDEARRCFAGQTLDILGPAPPPIERVKNRYRNQVLIKGKLTGSQKRELLSLYQKVADRERGGSSVEIRWDVDPESFY